MKYRVSDIFNFVETSSCSTIIQAARKLEISQPALSESIKRLESDLGAILFYRSRSGIKLTPSGRVFLDKARTVVQSLNDLDFSTDGSNIFSNRALIIGCHTTVAQYSIPKALAFLKAKAPDYNIELVHDLSRNIQAEVQRGHIDIGIVVNPTEVPDLVIQKLSTDMVGVWSHKDHQEFDTVICNTNLFQTQSILKKWKRRPKKIISTDSLELICRLVNEKIGCGILPQKAVELSGFHLKHSGLFPTYKDELSLIYRPEFGKSPSEKLTMQALKQSLT
ncbi:MAG: LysR family transcriptional regulator [Bacteriovorax sp.]